MDTNIRYEGAVGKTLRNWIERDKNARQAVKEVSKSGGFTFEREVGYDVLIRAGWRVTDDAPHTVIAATVRDVIGILKTLEPCDCKQCAAEKKLGY